MGYEHRYVFGRVVGYIDHRFVSEKIPYVSADVVIDAGKLTGFPDNLEDIYNWAREQAAKEKFHLYYDIIRDVAKAYMDSECRDDIVVIHWGY